MWRITRCCSCFLLPPPALFFPLFLQERVAHLEQHRNRLEATLSPLLVTALTTLDMEAAQRCCFCSCFCVIMSSSDWEPCSEPWREEDSFLSTAPPHPVSSPILLFLPPALSPAATAPPQSTGTTPSVSEPPGFRDGLPFSRSVPVFSFNFSHAVGGGGRGC